MMARVLLFCALCLFAPAAAFQVAARAPVRSSSSVTMAAGLKAGDSFEVPMARGYRAALVVPEGRSEGDVMWVYANAGVLRAGDDGDSNGERLALE